MYDFIDSLGLMSGTSMDGIDVSLIRTNGKDIKKIKFSKTYPYSPKTITALKYTFTKDKDILSDANNHENLSTLITDDHITAVKKTISRSGLTPDLIGFHGQTIFHNSRIKKSIQIGDGIRIANTFGINVVYDFRSNDIKNGGQGAPLIPIYHKYLTKKNMFDLPSCFLNIGGVANISYIDKKLLIGYDTGPGNGLMDTYIQKMTSNNFDYDGESAKLGVFNKEVVNLVLKDQYFQSNYPKSLDKLHFDYVFKLEKFKKLNFYDAMATLSVITENSIIKAIALLPKKPLHLIVHGGGAFNLNLINNLKRSFKVIIASEIDLSTEFMESELIAYLAARRLNKLPITFPETTGVKKPTIGGTLIKVMPYKNQIS